MKKIFTLLAVLISLTFSLEIIASNNQVVAKSSGFSSIDGKGVATFVVISPVAQTCDLSFLMMPGEYEDGSFTSVTLKVNGITLPNPITFSNYGWQFANTTGNAVTLNKGENIVQFISGSDDIPMIREVKIWKGESVFPIQNIFTSLSYDTKNKSRERNQRYTDEEGYNYLDPQQPLYRPGVKIGKKYAYTTCIDIYYEQRYSDNAPLPIIAHFYAPTSSDPVFGKYESDIDYNCYLFYKANPYVYSKRFSTTDHYVSWQDTLPVAGEYCLMLEPKKHNEKGYASIRINNSNLYRGCYLFYNIPERVNPDTSMVISIRDNIFNMFTTLNINSDTISHSPDPVLWLKQKIINESDTSDIIVAYSDTNTENSRFNWGKQGRIRTKLDYTKHYYLSVISAIPYIQDTIEICDLYHSYWNNIDTTMYLTEDSLRYFSNTFPGLVYEDAIESGRANNVYNCFAWSAGIMYNHVSGNSIENLDLLYANKDFYNDYGKTRRPPNAPIYTREGATFENAVVDIWGGVTPNNDTILYHATIRNPYSGIPNGYDWESKDVFLHRYFHPRIVDMGYGEIIAHYTLAPGQEEVKYSYEGIAYSSVADGEMIIEDVQLTEDEKSLLSQNISLVSTYGVNRFEQYYNQWKEYAKAKFHFSDFECYKDTIAYPQLVNYILSNPGEEYKAYEKFDEGDYFAAVLIKDISSIEEIGRAHV